jgi:Protein of unknown function (DUF3634)
MKRILDAITEYIWRVVHDPFFVVAISNRQATTKKGKLTQKFLSECSTICIQDNIQNGYVYGLSTSQGIRLRFSSNIPKHYHQRFRNVWANSNDNPKPRN